MLVELVRAFYEEGRSHNWMATALHKHCRDNVFTDESLNILLATMKVPSDDFKSHALEHELHLLARRAQRR